jgi:prepilin-type N-terminal cleavage/methylation domain-containing protein
MSKRAFTLIELLIVVAIIAILAAIAVPNFMEAQMRAKIAREKTDLRTLALAMSAYQVDNDDWCIGPQDGPAPTWQNYIPRTSPTNWWNWLGYSVEFGQWFHLTTPIPYLASVPHDTFKRLYNEQWGIWEDYYRMWNFANKQPSGQWGCPSTYYAKINGIAVLMAGVGPDCVEDVSDGTAWGIPVGRGASSGLMIYDPTNGTMSSGDIYYGLPGTGFDIQQKIVP